MLVFVFSLLADAISNYAMDIGAKTWWQLKRLKLGDHFVRSSDRRSSQRNGLCASSAAITLYREGVHPQVVVAACALPVTASTNAEAEIEGAVLAL